VAHDQEAVEAHRGVDGELQQTRRHQETITADWAYGSTVPATHKLVRALTKCIHFFLTFHNTTALR
jgi:hypothetical protein